MEKIVIAKMFKEVFEMLLFFRLLLYFFIITILFISIILLSKLKIQLELLEYDTSNNKLKYDGKILLVFLKKIKIFSKRISSDKPHKFKFKIKAGSKLYKSNLDIVKKILNNIEIESLKMIIKIDTENVGLTSYLVGIIATLIPNLIRNNIKKLKKDLYEWKVEPIYKNYNFVSLKLESIISIKVVHIINMLKLIGGKENERTSNRRLNANCNGKY